MASVACIFDCCFGLDCTDAGVLRRIERHVGKDCWELMRGRVRMINMYDVALVTVRYTSFADLFPHASQVAPTEWPNR